MQLKRLFSFYLFPLAFALPLFISSCRPAKEISKTEQRSSEKENKPTVSSTKLEKKYAELLNVNEDRISNTKLYSFIDDWYGVPYKYGGQNKKGIDCSNFAATLYATIYNKQLKGSSASIFNQCKVISRSDLKEGDLLFFKIEKEDISHIAVYLQNNKFVHATTKKGVMIDDLDEAYYKKYFYKAGRVN
ncbi:MAG: glycoside hydrolase [Bacteroidetes bacterium]|nr:glycoside hydrolase [Bacteroidota bacterium]